jgi:uncharacterized protein (TIGR03000 family)
MKFRQLTLVAAFALMLAATPALAQRGGGRGGGHGGGPAHGHYGGYSRPIYGGYSPGYYAPRYAYPSFGSGLSFNYARPGFGIGVTLGSPYYSTLGYGYRPWSYGGYAFGSSSWYFPTTYRYPVVYSAPATAAIVGSAVPVVPYTAALPGDQPPAATGPTLAAPPTPTTNAPVHVEVWVPDGAQVWLGPTASDQTGAVRTFVSPPLDPSVEYVYTVRGQWVENGQPVVREKKVTVRAGERVTVDLNRP